MPLPSRAAVTMPPSLVVAHATLWVRAAIGALSPLRDIAVAVSATATAPDHRVMRNIRSDRLDETARAETVSPFGSETDTGTELSAVPPSPSCPERV